MYKLSKCLIQQIYNFNSKIYKPGTIGAGKLSLKLNQEFISEQKNFDSPFEKIDCDFLLCWQEVTISIYMTQVFWL